MPDPTLPAARLRIRRWAFPISVKPSSIVLAIDPEQRALQLHGRPSRRAARKLLGQVAELAVQLNLPEAVIELAVCRWAGLGRADCSLSLAPLACKAREHHRTWRQLVDTALRDPSREELNHIPRWERNRDQAARDAALLAPYLAEPALVLCESAGPVLAISAGATKQGGHSSWDEATGSTGEQGWSHTEDDRVELASDALRLLARLKLRRVRYVRLQYSGCGDEGDIEELAAEGGPPLSEEEETLLEDLVLEVLQARCPGWEINEGSNGEFEFDLTGLMPRLIHAHTEPVPDTSTMETFLPLVDVRAEQALSTPRIAGELGAGSSAGGTA